MKELQDSYEKKLNEFYQGSERRMEQLFIDNLKLDCVLNRISKGCKKGINFKELDDSFELYKWIEINKGVKVKKNFSSKSILELICVMEKNSKLGWHKHNDCREKIEVLSGVFYDAVKNKYYMMGDVIEYKKGEYHSPGALEKTTIKITFEKK